MDYASVIMNLYFLLVNTDEEGANQKEIAAAKEMIHAEGISEDAFHLQMQLLKTKDRGLLYSECLRGIRDFDRKHQIRIIAWLCVIANADGFMDRNEWQFIYTIYHKELDLPLSEIFAVQKEFNRLIWEKNLISPSL